MCSRPISSGAPEDGRRCDSASTRRIFVSLTCRSYSSGGPTRRTLRVTQICVPIAALRFPYPLPMYLRLILPCCPIAAGGLPGPAMRRAGRRPPAAYRRRSDIRPKRDATDQAGCDCLYDQNRRDAHTVPLPAPSSASRPDRRIGGDHRTNAATVNQIQLTPPLPVARDPKLRPRTSSGRWRMLRRSCWSWCR